MAPSEKLKESPSQTAGPYVHIGCVPNHCGITGVYPEDLGAVMLGNDYAGDTIKISGIVYDGNGDPLLDAMLEIWQANADGRYADGDQEFTGWGRAASDDTTGAWQFDTIIPGPVSFRGGGMMAPHITFWIVARGINIGLQTRMYFPDEPIANAADPVLHLVGDRDRAQTLIAATTAPRRYRFDIHLQGPKETVFFDV